FMNICKGMQCFNVILYWNRNLTAFILPFMIFVAFYLSFQNFERCQYVCLCRVGVHEVFLTIEFVSSFECTLLHLMENILNVDEIAIDHNEGYASTQEFFHKYGDIKFIRVETSQISVADKLCESGG